MPGKSLNLPKQRVVRGPASTWKRLFAFIIDMFIINLILWMPFRGKIEMVMPKNMDFGQALEFSASNPGVTSVLSFMIIIMGLIALLYFALLEYKLGQTIGKILMKIFVISDKKRLGFFQALVRSMYLIFIFPFWLLFIIDPIFLLLNKNHQRLSEILSKTRTVQDYVM